MSELLAGIKQTLLGPSIGCVLFSSVLVVTLQDTACATSTDTEVLLWAVTGWFSCLSSGVAMFYFHIP